MINGCNVVAVYKWKKKILLTIFCPCANKMKIGMITSFESLTVLSEPFFKRLCIRANVTPAVSKENAVNAR